MVLAATLSQLSFRTPEAARGETPRSQDLTSGADHGRQLFAHVWSQEEGLGPEFNARACAACHASPGPGGAGTDRESIVHLSAGTIDPTGGHVVRQFVVGPGGRIGRRPSSADATLRRAPALFGLGVLERVPEHVPRENADPDDRNGDGVSGRLAVVSGGVGRFGWKARFATLDDAVTAAFANELGLTTSRYPATTTLRGQPLAEVDEHAWRAVSAFARALAPPTPAPDASGRGGEFFDRVGCARCHRPSLTIAADAIGIEQARTIHPYTDLLLHDMGPALADGPREDDASPQEFRTPPLWGLSRRGPPYLHDGRATTVHDAIVMHDGEAAGVTATYSGLPDVDRQTLLRFIESRE